MKKPEIDIVLNEEGAGQFYRFTIRNISKQIAILIYDNVHSAPVVSMGFEGGEMSISAEDMNSIIHFYQTSLFKYFPTMKVISLSIE